VPTVKRQKTSRDKHLSNISTVSNEESYLGSGRSESSVLFREREKDTDVDVRARKKSLLYSPCVSVLVLYMPSSCPTLNYCLSPTPALPPIL